MTRDGHGRRLDVEIKFTEFPYPWAAVNLTMDGCKSVLLAVITKSPLPDVITMNEY